MDFQISETINGTQHTNATLSYLVTKSSGGIYTVNMTLATSETQNITYTYVVDANNNTVLSATYAGFTFYGSDAKTEFDATMSLFGLEETFGGAISVYTSSQYVHSTGHSSMTFGTTTFEVYTYVANSLPLAFNSCGISSDVTAFTLEVGTPPGTSLQFITYLNFASTSPTELSVTFQLISMTEG